MKGFKAVGRMVIVGVLMGFVGSVAAQQAYPSKTIRIIVPYPPGGTTSPLARLVGQKLTNSWGQQVLVDNRGGGNTIIGTETLAKSAADGYTLIQVTSSHCIIPNLLSTPYDAVKDFAPVATLVSTELILVVHPSVPADDLRAFIAYAKSKPGELNFSSPSSGGPGHLAGELFNIMAGVKIQHIPYKGGGQAITDLIGGYVQLMFANAANVIAHVKNGKLKALAVTGQTRMAGLPEVPTYAEGGLPSYDPKGWMGILAPAGTPKAIVDRLSTEIARILIMPDTKEKLDSQGFEPFISTPAQLAALMKADMARYAKIIKTANIKLEQ